MILTILEVAVSVLLGVVEWLKGLTLDMLFLIVAAAITAMVVAFSYNFVLDMIK